MSIRMEPCVSDAEMRDNPNEPKQRRKWGLFRLFECIGTAGKACCAMRKGSPQDYTAEIGCYEQPTQQSRKGEPHECYPLYRIGRTQENHQLLHKDRRRPDCAGRHPASGTDGIAALGERPAATLAWSHGSHAVQRLDLRHPETLRPAALYGPPGQDEGHHRREE